MIVCFEDGLHPAETVLDSNGKQKVILNTSLYISLSKYIDDYYKQDDNVNIVFMNGNGNVFREIKNLDRTKQHVIYIDVPADNKHIIPKICNCLDFIMDNNFKHILLIPIPAIEYCALKAFGIDFVDLGLYKDSEYYKAHSTKCTSYEKYCKKLFNSTCAHFSKTIPVDRWVEDLKISSKIVEYLPFRPVSVYSDPNSVRHSFEDTMYLAAQLFNSLIEQHNLYKEHGYIQYRGKYTVEVEGKTRIKDDDPMQFEDTARRYIEYCKQFYNEQSDNKNITN